jgi:hypothetical protein
MGGVLGEVNRLIHLAEAYGKKGHAEAGLHILADVLTTVHKTAEHHCESELYRLKGELLLQQAMGGSIRNALLEKPVISEIGWIEMTHVLPFRTEAEACFFQAIEVAGCQHAKSLELRAVMSLCYLWQTQGKRAEAYQKLAETYNWFTEGFDTLDLQEAKALLEALQ